MSKSVNFDSAVFPFHAERIALHRNPVTCVLLGLERPIVVHYRGELICNDILIIRPGIEHEVDVQGEGRALYFDGLDFPFSEDLACSLPRQLAPRAFDAAGGDLAALGELRDMLGKRQANCPDGIARLIREMDDDPMYRPTQFELAHVLSLERTQALRRFKDATGMTFRSFKQWNGLKAASRQILNGEKIRTAALDAGFADSAHFTRSFRAAFGTTPVAATKRLAV